MRTVLAVLFVAALALLLWTQWPEAQPRSARAPDAAAEPGPSPLAPSAADATPSPPANDRALVGPLPPDQAPTTGALQLTVRWNDGAPAANEPIELEFGGEATLADARDVVTDRDGVVALADLPPGPVRAARHGDPLLAFAIVAGQTTRCEARIAAGIDVHGIVVDEEGQPVPTARVWLSHQGRGDFGREVTAVRADGTFALRAVAAGLHFLAAIAPGKRASNLTPIQDPAGSRVDVRLELRFPGVSLLGRVFRPDQRPAGGAHVLVGNRNAAAPWTQERFFRDLHPTVDTRCDERGQFRADGLSPGSTVAVWLRADDSATLLQNVQLTTDRDSVVQFDLFAGASLHGRARHAGDEPAANATITARSDALFDLKRLDLFRGPTWAMSQTSTRADGSYELAHVAAGQLRLDAHLPTAAAATTLPAKDKEPLTWDPVLAASATIQGYVVDDHSAPLADWHVAAESEGPKQTRTAATDARGHFELADCGTSRWRVSVRRADAVVDAATKPGVPGGTTDLRFVVPRRVIPDATMIGRVATADGSPLPKAGIAYWFQGALAFATAPVAADGSFRIGLLPPGGYRVRAYIGRARTPWSDPFSLRQGETLDLGTLRAPAPGSVRATVRDANGQPLDGVECQIVESIEGLDQAFAGARTQQGVATIQDLAPGEYRLRIAGRDQPIVHAPFAIESGKQTEVEITVPNSIACNLHLQPPSEGAPLQVSFTWSRDGAVFLQHTDLWRENGELVLPRRLVPGDYAIAIVSETGARSENRFTVAAGDADGREIVIKLP